MRIPPIVATEAGFLAVIIAVFVFNALHFWPQAIDDSYITFRFAENLLNGQGLRFNPHDLLVEGFTSPAWVVLSAIALLLRLDPMVVAKLVGLTSGFAILILSWRFTTSLRRRTDGWNLLPPLVIATNAHFAFWSMQGMETLLQSVVVLAAIHWTLRFLLDGRRALLSTLAILFAVFVRIDSLLHLTPLAVFALAAIIVRSRAQRIENVADPAPIEATEATAPFPPPLYWASAIIALLLLMEGVRFLIFGDWLPNTYYAKVALPAWNGERANAYLIEFFLGQASWPGASVFYAIATMNLWLAAIIVPMIGVVMDWRHRSSSTTALLVATIAITTWYAWHVGGDWMPGFRFLISTIVLMAILLPVAVDAWTRLCSTHRIARHAGLAFLLLLVIGSIIGQLRTETAYVFGRDPIWVERTQPWFSVAAVRERLRRGFEPALLETTAVLALETEAGATILMSDIGLPLWSSPHLNLIDADGLVDKHIADAPSVRTQLTRELIAREVRNDIADRPLTAETRRWIRAETERLYRDAVVQQNARRIMEEVRPEYILVFEIHPSEVTAEPGQRYPDLIDRVTRHANFEDYVLQQSWRKLDGNVWNHLYRRSDVSVGLSPEERAERLAVLIERNPRVRIFQFMDAAGRTMIGGDR